MASTPAPSGGRSRRTPTPSGARRSASTRAPSGRPTRCHLDLDAARAAGHPDLVAPPMFAVVYCAEAIEEAMLDPAVGIDFAMLLHGGAGVRAGGRSCTPATRSPPQVALADVSRAHRARLLPLRVALGQPARRGGLRRRVDADREAAAHERLRARRRSCPSCASRPTRDVTDALRRRLRRLQPDPPRRRVRALRRAAGAHPPRPLHDGARRASADRRPPAGPSTSSGSRVQFRGTAVPETEITISSTRQRPRRRPRARSARPRRSSAAA